jgi:long-subunit acyl-CoA synthetase (AMP-forming)
MSSFWELKTQKPESTALATTERAISYLELNQLVDSAVIELNRATSGVKQVIGLEFDLSVQAIINYIAALKAGYPVLIVEPFQLASGSPLSERWLPKYSYCKTPTSQNNLKLFTNGETYSDIHPDLKILLSTSGTTGDPKLVRLSTENIASNASSIAEYLDITSEDVAATTLPLFYSYGLSVLNSYLSRGAGSALSKVLT